MKRPIIGVTKFKLRVLFGVLVQASEKINEDEACIIQ